MSMAFHVDQRLYGFCDGFFGRDSYGTKVVEGKGSDWVLVRECNGPLILVTRASSRWWPNIDQVRAWTNYTQEGL